MLTNAIVANNECPPSEILRAVHNVRRLDQDSFADCGKSVDNAELMGDNDLQNIQNSQNSDVDSELFENVNAELNERNVDSTSIPELLLPFTDSIDPYEETVVCDVEECENESVHDDTLCDDEELPSYTSTGVQTNFPRYSIEQFQNNPEGILHFTGLETYEKFMTVLCSLGPGAYHLKYERKHVGNISVENQFFLVLWKLRRNASDYELSEHFNIPRIAVGNIFITWIKFMSTMWSLIDIWPSRELVDFYMPKSFKKHFPRTRVIVDGTEFKIDRPRNPRLQQSSFSTYKNTSTMKALIGCTPGGLISYVSPVYGGSTSDRQIVERSDLPKKCNSGDVLMADKAFTVQDICAPHNVTVATPTFVKGKGYLPHETIMKDRLLSKHRIHIERIIGLLKTYKFLAGKLNHNYVPLASEIVAVIVMLCNFKEDIMGE